MSNCQFDLSGCSSCGNGRIDAGEQCDGAMLGGATCTSLGMGFSGGTLRCGAGCRYDTAMCAAAFDPTGTWRFSQGAMHTCAFGLVNITFGALNFNATGSVLNVSGGGMGCVMTGASARATRRVSVTCTVPGSCAEVYTLTGMFTSDAAFTGTFTTAFVGGATACLNCTGRSFTVSATR